MSLLINLLTISRVLFSIIIFLLIFNGSYVTSIFVFFLASISDYFDGFLARKYNKESAFGEILDPVADKILVLFSLFAIAINLKSYLIGFFSALILSRELWVGALRDYNARTNNTNATKVTFLAKIKTSLQMTTIILYLIALASSIPLLIVLADIFLLTTTVITIKTGLDYSLNSLYKS